MDVMPLREDIELELAHTRLILAALPAHPCFAVDRELLTRHDFNPAQLAYAFWPGHKRTGPCALLAVSFDLERLPTERWRWEPPPGRGQGRECAGGGVRARNQAPWANQCRWRAASASVTGVRRRPRSALLRT